MKKVLLILLLAISNVCISQTNSLGQGTTIKQNLIVDSISCRALNMTIATSNNTPQFNSNDTNVVFVWIITGQSNAVGLALNSNATASEIDQDNSTFIYNTVSNTFDKLNISAGNNKGLDNTRHGLELQLAQIRESKYPTQKAYIIKHAIGSTNIDAQLPGGAVYDSVWTHYVQEGINNLISAGKKPIVSLFYLQGEANADNSTNSLNFSNKLSQLIRQWKYNLGEDLPIIFNDLITNNIAYPYKDSISSAFADATRNFHNVRFINNSQYTYLDGAHMNYSGMKKAANYMFDASLQCGGGIELQRVLPQPKTINNFEHFYNQYTPTSSSDAKGQVGNYTYDENYMYIKTNGGWKRIALSTF